MQLLEEHGRRGTRERGTQKQRKARQEKPPTRPPGLDERRPREWEYERSTQMYPPTRQGRRPSHRRPRSAPGSGLLSWRAEVELCEGFAAKARRAARSGRRIDAGRRVAALFRRVRGELWL